MGLGKFLTTPFGCKMRFREPFLVKARLRGELKSKLVKAGVCMVLSLLGMLIAADASGNQTFTPGVALGLGTIIGGLLIVVFVFRGKDSGGTVYLRKKHIRRSTMESEGLSQWITFREETWPYEKIQECRIIHHSSSGLGFSVLEIHGWNEVDEIGVPRSADLKLLARSLQESGVSVSYKGEVPLSDLTKPIVEPLLKIFVVLAAVVTAYYMGTEFLAEKGQGNRNKPAGNVPVAQNPIPAVAPRERFPDRSPKRKPPPPPPPAKSKRPKEPSSDEPSSGLASRAAAFFGDLARGPSGPPSPIGIAPPEPANIARSGASEPSQEPASSYRTWSDATGKFQVEAILVGRQGEKVALRKRDGLTVVVPIERLCEADRAYLATSEQKEHDSTDTAAGDEMTAALPKGTKQDTAMAGGDEGWEFRHEDTKPLLGIEYRLGSWGGEKTVGRIEPIFDRQATDSRRTSAVAKDGYAVGSLKVSANQFVNGMQIVFMRLERSGRLDPSDSYTSEWIGYQTGRRTETLNAAGTTVIGVYGRHGAILNAVGLILMGH